VKATLIEYTGAGREDPYAAADILIFAKNTRVKMSPDGLQEIRDWSNEKKDKELEYIANTIPGSWEMVDYTFFLEDVTRALTHQLVRTRTASYAQQTMQILDVRGFGYEVGPSLEKDAQAAKLYCNTMVMIDEHYKKLIDMGVEIEDARGILPTNIYTNIVMKANLRTFVDLFHARISPRNYGSMSQICRQMRDEMLRVHPWVRFFLERTVDRAMEDLDREVKALPGSNDPGEAKYRILKLVDQLRRKS
jgi:thymidylate synthase (FAD)